MKPNFSNQEESSLFKNSFFNIKAVEEGAEEPYSKRPRIDQETKHISLCIVKKIRFINRVLREQ